MSKIKSNNTKSEVKLRKALFAKGLRFRLNNKSMYGSPDITIKKYKLVIFIDGEFWHGYNWGLKKTKISSNKHYWIPKIEKNIARDLAVNDYYGRLGWGLFRYWEKDVNKHLNSCVDEIISYLTKVKENTTPPRYRKRPRLWSAC